MATPELAQGEEYDFDGVHIEGEWVSGECHIITTTDGWKRREVDVEINDSGIHIDGIEYERVVPVNEKSIVFGAVAKFVRIKNPELITAEDPDGNLL
jgi:hypothetical protein